MEYLPLKGPDNVAMADVLLAARELGDPFGREGDRPQATTADHAGQFGEWNRRNSAPSQVVTIPRPFGPARHRPASRATTILTCEHVPRYSKPCRSSGRPP